jgi:cytidylate kinase
MPAGEEIVTIDDLADLVVTATGSKPSGGSWIVALDGWSGSGKTSLADRLAPALDAPCIHMDDWVPGWSGLARSVDLLVEGVLTPLAEGKPARWRRWDWERDDWGDEREQPPAPLILVEGCGAGAARVRPLLSELIWLDVTPGQRAARLRARPDWPTYEPWTAMWAEQEAALRAGDDVAGAADLVVGAGDETATRLVVQSRL